MKLRYLFLLSIVLAVVGIVALRQNNVRVYEIRDQIVAIDQERRPTEEEIEQLRDFSFAHMNASAELNLKSSYDRAVAEAQAQARSSAGDDLYAQAQRACDRQGVLTRENARCVEEYLEARLDDGQTLEEPQMPEAANFKYAYTSPVWAPDLAGWTLLGAAIAAVTGFGLYLRRLFEQQA